MDAATEKENLPEEESENNDMKGKYLTFWTDGQLFGVPISDVVQIIGMQEITPIPDSPAYAKGVINLRGFIIPLIDVRLRFGKPEAEYNERTCIVVTSLEENYIGFIVDSVNEVATIDDDNISPPPKVVSRDRTNAYLTGVGKIGEKVVLLLDTNKILNADEIEQVTGAVQNLNEKRGDLE
ncbi:MAG TPA: chemotaxis protein CheW [Ruminococcaceae bacterium]|jgi:purine-binding chemotaxis protein CheW|nr:chemotaxis protein CheW [Oscillospiraceae bacterium]